MKRDWNLIRLLLLELEGEIHVDKRPYTEKQLAYHRYLLAQSPLANGVTVEMPGYPVDACWGISPITERGHDFLSWARDYDRWDYVMTYLSDRGLPQTLDMIEQVAAS